MGLVADLRYAARALRRRPGLSVTVIAVLALAIGANTAIFSLLDSVLLRPLPVRDPASLVVLQWSAKTWPDFSGALTTPDCAPARAIPRSWSGCWFSEPFVRSLEAAPAPLAGVTAMAGATRFTLSGHGAATTLETRAVLGNFFQVIGVPAAAGRVLTPADDRPGAPPALVLSYDYWRRAFGGDTAAIGMVVSLDRKPATIVGVAPRGFGGVTPGGNFDAWITVGALQGLDPRFAPTPDSSREAWLVPLARLRPGARPAAAQAAINGRWRNAVLNATPPLLKAADDPALTLAPAQRALSGARQKLVPSLELLFGIAAAILLLACANIAGLLVAAGARRGHEFALRRALGASRARLARQRLIEALVLAVPGGVAGLGLAVVGARLLRAFLLSSSGGNAPLLPLPLDGRVLGFTAAAAAVAGTLAGLAPAAGAGRGALAAALKQLPGSAARSQPGRRLPLGHGLVVAQLALAMVVLAATGVLVRTLMNLRNIAPGFNATHLLLFQLSPADAGYRGTAAVALYSRLRRRLAALPGVEGVTYSDYALLSGDNSSEDVSIGGRRHLSPYAMSVGPDYFATLGIPLLLGRSFTPADFRPPPPWTSQPPATPFGPIPTVVNQAFARAYLGAGNPLGQRFGNQYESYEVVGVAGNTKYWNLRHAVVPTFFTPDTSGDAEFQLRTAAAPLGLARAVRRAIAQVDPNLAVTGVTTEAATVDQLLFKQRLLARLGGLFAVLALLLAALGLVALLAQDVARRTREIGIRMALGASRRDVLGMVLLQGMGLTAGGLIVGLAGAWALTRLLHGALYGVSAFDPVSLAVVAGLLLAAAVAACLLPARRAAGVDPLAALRTE